MAAPRALARVAAHETSRERARSDDIWISIFDLEPGTCPKCFAPIEPERLPEADLCLDCVVER